MAHYTADSVCPDGPACPDPDCKRARRLLGLDRGPLFPEIQRRGIQFDSHESDLYIPVTPETVALVQEYYPSDTPGRYSSTITTFISNTDGRRWFDVPFAYLPWWEARGHKA